ncbi:membrane-associated protein, putative [Bodo saltans]|uniref:Membrane-associated protein, putative n=1 Tax=Bodo saltans TaxID=75058 RepID=A0A0S4J6Q6_BODSA|nr:membrane-associated protein, putative [Bodo saltans]|eukprot:CUG87134.1 membrane-associated protein, putative [Bodo saltans]
MALSTSTFLYVLVAASVLVLGVYADATAESVLECNPLRVEPNQNISCIIYVKDSTQDPTSRFSLGDFSIYAIPVVSGTVVTTSTPVVGADLVSIWFTVSAATGTNIAINVYTSAGVAIRGSGVAVSVLVWPATRIGNISCTADNFNSAGALPLRASTMCTASVYGSNNLAAVVRPGDIYLTEDHFAGTFVFVSGSAQLVFTYTAPNTIVSAFDAYKLRVTLSSSNVLYSTSIPMAYPVLPATSVSSLQCTGVLRTTCFISAQDNLGPVVYQNASFSVAFEALSDANSDWATSTSQFNLTLAAGTTTNIEQLSWALINNNQISTQRVRAFFVAPTTGARTEIVGSPFVFTAGVAPTSATVSFRGCADKYVGIGNSTTCTIDLLEGATGDSRYYTVSSYVSAKISSPLVYTAVDPSGAGTPILTFTYTAPSSISVRTEDSLSVTVAGSAVLNSPRRVIVYVPAAAVVTDSTNENRPGLIALGMSFFGSWLCGGAIIFWRRQQRIHRVQLARVAREREEFTKQFQGVVEEHHTFATAHGASFADSAQGSCTASFEGGEAAPTPPSVQMGSSVPVSVPTHDILGDIGRPRSGSTTSSTTTGKSRRSDPAE